MNAVKIPSPGAVKCEETTELGKFLRDIIRFNKNRQDMPEIRNWKWGS
jgi:phosphoketolase